MHKIIDIHELKKHFSRIVDDVALGAEVLIFKAGKPIARLVPIEIKHNSIPKRLGILEGKFDVPDDFNSLLTDKIVTLFQGDEATSIKFHR